MAWVILPENSASPVCISLNILRTSDFFTAECDEVLLYGQAAIEVRNHDGHTTSCGGQYIEFTLLAQLSDVPKQTPLAIVAGFDGNKRVLKVFFVFWIMLQAQIVWFSLEFLSDNFTVALFLFTFSSSDKLGDHQIHFISYFPCRDHQSVQVLSAWTSKQSWESLCALTWAGGVKMNQMKIAGAFFVLCFQILIRFLDEF